MEDALTEVFHRVPYVNLIVEANLRTVHPKVSTFNNSDEISLVIDKGDLITATFNSTLYLEGTFTVKEEGKTFTLTHNAPLCLFEEIRFLLGDQIIETCRLPGINSAIKGVVSYSPAQSKALTKTGWHPLGENLQISPDKKSFSASIPLSHILGFAEGHQKDIINMRQELVLVRAKSDLNCYSSADTDVTITLSKVVWKVPHVIPNDEEKLKLYHGISQNVWIPIAFHERNLNIYPGLPQSKNVVWSVRSNTGFQRPQWVLCAFQVNKNNNRAASATAFDDVSLQNLAVYLNERRYPYEQQNYDFDKNRYMSAYDEYLDFSSTYYGKREAGPLLDYAEYKKCPIFVVNLTKQNESIQNIVLNVKLDIESRKDIPANTTAYCLILHDVVVEYQPFTGLIRKLQ